MEKRFSPEQIVSKLRQADVELGKGLKVPEVCKQLGVSQQTYYRWRTKYGGMAPQMAKQFKALEKENVRLKKLVADQALDMAILREAARPNLETPNDGVGPWTQCVVVWGTIRYHNAVHAMRWVSPAVPSGTGPSGRNSIGR